MPLVVYTLIRLALIAVAWVVLWLAGLSGPIAFAAAVLIGLMVSYLAFRGPRDAAARWLADRAARRRAAKGPRASGIEDDADVEDRAVDAATSPGPDRAPSGDQGDPDDVRTPDDRP